MSTSVVARLGRVGLETTCLPQWLEFVEDDLEIGAATVGADGEHHLNVGGQQGALSLREGDTDRVDYIGWDVHAGTSLPAFADELAGAGVEVHRGSATERGQRGVPDLIWFQDPHLGVRTELYQTDAASAETLPTLAHVLLLTPQAVQAKTFYESRLGFRLTDFRGSVFFMRCSPRHHSIGIVEDPDFGIEHFAIEFAELDDVGRRYERAHRRPGRVRCTLGRHFNDRAVSFYIQTPWPKLQVEVGWGGLHVDERTWVTREFSQGSAWGHWDVPADAHTGAAS
jgi:catechol 2,3-dioxygenase-like lactoylglutathione lyase family enzyme